MNEESHLFPPSFPQEALWFLDQLAPGNPFYNLAVVLRLEGRLDGEALRASLNTIVQRHDSLRTTFATVDGQPMQAVASAAALPLPVADLTAEPPVSREAAALRLMREEARRPFDLGRGPLVRANLLRLGDEAHLLLVSMHHIISDGWSMGVFMRELAALYEAAAAGRPSPLPEPPIQYPDYAVWQREQLDEAHMDELIGYWKRQLGGSLPTLELPTDHARPPVPSFRGATPRRPLPPELAASARALARQEGATLFAVLLAAFQALLYRYTGQIDIILGSPAAGRTQPEVEPLIGFFINTLVLRTDLSGNPSFRELLRRARQVVQGAYAHQELPFDKLVRALQPERDISRTPIFQVSFALNSTPPSYELPGLRMRPSLIDIGTARFDLSLIVEETGPELVVAVEHSADLFDAPTIERLIGHYRTILAGAVDHPERRLSELPLLTEAERRQIVVDWNDTRQPYSPDVCIHHLFEAQVERTPDAVAVVLEDRRLTYRELNERANRLAHHLRSLGIGPEARVGLSVERSLDMMIGLLGILKAGGGYVPLDPTYPADRLAYMLQDSGAAVLITTNDHRPPTNQARSFVVGRSSLVEVDLARDWPSIARSPASNPTTAVVPENLAYVVYTSGSTGRPKGAMIFHRAICNSLLWMQHTYPLTEADAFLQVFSFSFDAAAWEFFGPLIAGARVVLIRPGGQQDSAYLVGTIAAQQVTTVQLVPSLLRVLLEEPGIERCSSLRRVFCGGEAMPVELRQRFFTRLPAKLYNLYGPTETSIWGTYCPCEPDNERLIVPIGRPIGNAQVYLVDQHLQLVPIGVPGELLRGGIGLAHGYLGRPDLTAEKFVPDPFLKDEGGRMKDESGAFILHPSSLRLYRTGDLARYLADGNIEYLGRIDHQVKVRGFRVELGEIEAVLDQHPNVETNIIVAREDSPSNKRLVAYVVPKRQPAPTVNELRGFLQAKLPDYMVPAAFVLLERMPLNPNGKVDRAALPVPDAARPQLAEAFVAPRSAVEEVLAGIWADVLGLDQVGIHDNFFVLGGHSLLATQVIAQLNEVFQTDMPLRTLFEATTVASLAEALLRDPHGRARIEKTAEVLIEVAGLSEEEAEQRLSGGAPGG